MMKNDASYEILDLMARYENDTEAALKAETSPECLYAFSPLRENLFEWTEIQGDSRVLQIGSDYGSYTGPAGPERRWYWIPGTKTWR